MEKAQLNGTAKVVGDLTAKKLVVIEGAAFKGMVHVGPDAVKGRSGTPAASTAMRRVDLGTSQARARMFVA